VHASHEPWLVALSVLMAIQGAYVGFVLAGLANRAHGVGRRVLLAASSVTLAVAIWSMHFIGMLAARWPFPVDYLVFPTLLSFLVSVLVVGVGVYAATAGPLTARRLVASATFMGLGIVSMHYIGMLALHASAHMVHAPLFVAASIAIAIAASGLALRFAAASSASPPMLWSAVTMGIAISGMHYTAMAGLTVFPHAHHHPVGLALSRELLAIVVAVVASIVSGLFLLILVPDRSGPDIKSPATSTDVGVDAAASDTAPKANGAFLPVERDRAIYLLPVDMIVAVRANAHYTEVFDGSATYFCSLAIGDVEARLEDGRFARVHRSYIVNLDRIVALKITGDNGQLELEGRDPYFAPVSRSRMAWIKSRLGLKAHHRVT
jgi:NO-binding membrane sensor protein with MHYT domain